MGRFDNVVEIWYVLIKNGFNFDGKVCRVLVFGLCGGGKVDLVYEFIVDIIKGGELLDILVYNFFVSGFCKIG